MSAADQLRERLVEIASVMIETIDDTELLVAAHDTFRDLADRVDNRLQSVYTCARPTTPKEHNMNTRMQTRSLRKHDVIVWNDGGECAWVVSDPTVTDRGTTFRLQHHDGSEAGYYTPTLDARQLTLGETVDTPSGTGTVVGFDRPLRRVLVQRPNVNGVDAVRFSSIVTVQR